MIIFMFNNIGRCVFEFFHLGMNYLKRAIFDRLWNEDGKVEVGTMRGECERIFRNNVDPNVNKSYEDDNRFVVGFKLVEAAIEFFNLENLDSSLDVSIESSEDKEEWGKERLKQFVEEYIFPIWTHSRVEENSIIQECAIYTSSSGKRIDIPIIQPKTAMLRPKLPDKKKDYGHFVLESRKNSTFTQDDDAPVKRFKRKIKICPRNIKNARTAIFCDGNKRGISSVPAALVCLTNMSLQVWCKSGITAALPGINQICEKEKNDQSDILTVTNDLRRIRSFNHTEQRKYDAFPKIKMSPTEDVDMEKFKEWFELKK
ncbi:LOW QUALITY PROTEIN: hypothetical protein MAR_035047, partial [Mya arenaria]